MEYSFRITPDKFKYLHDCYVQSPILHMCSHLISTQLLNNGIAFCKGGCKSNRMEETPQMQAETEDIWIPFTHELITHVLCFGFAVVCVEEGLPKLLNIGHFVLQVSVTLTSYEYKVMTPTAVDEEIPNCIVFDHFGHRLTSKGQFTSIVHKVVPRLLFLKRLRETALAMEQRRAENLVFTEAIESNKSTESREGVDYDFYADSNTSQISEELKYQRNKMNVSILNQQMDLYDQYLNRSHARKAEKTLQNVVPLPSGQHMVLPPSQTGRGDLSGLHKTIIEDVCATLGVPRSIIMAESTGGLGGGGDNEGKHEVFQATVLAWKKKLSVVLSHVYNVLHSEEIKGNVMKEINKTKSDMYEAKLKHSVKVFFPVTPFVTNEMLRTLYEQGVIDFKTYAKYAVSNISLPIEDLNKKYLKNGPPIDEMLFEKPPTPVQQMLSGGGANLNNKRKAEEGSSGGEKSTKKKKKTTSETVAET